MPSTAVAGSREPRPLPVASSWTGVQLQTYVSLPDDGARRPAWQAVKGFSPKILRHAYWSIFASSSANRTGVGSICRLTVLIPVLFHS